MNTRELFLNAAIAAGCPEDQTRNFFVAKLWLQERQLVASAAVRFAGWADGHRLRRRSRRRQIVLENCQMLCQDHNRRKSGK
jgi:hypothetical protein